jgi:hypothetical protein
LLYQVKVYDPEAENISFSLDTDLFNIEDNGSIIFIPGQYHVDISPIKFNITISDGKLNAKNEFELIVMNVPDPPVIKSINDQYSEAGKKFELRIIASDIDSEKLYYYDNTSLFSIDIDSGLISFTPDNNQVGKYIIMITVTDDTFLSTDVVFKLMVNKSKDNDINGHEPDNNETKDGEVSDKSGDWYLMLAIIIIVVIFIGLISILLIRRRKRVETEKAEQEYFVENKDGTPSTPKLSYEEEYQKLYSTSPEPQVKQQKQPRRRPGKRTRSKTTKKEKPSEKEITSSPKKPKSKSNGKLEKKRSIVGSKDAMKESEPETEIEWEE